MTVQPKMNHDFKPSLCTLSQHDEGTSRNHSDRGALHLPICDSPCSGTREDAAVAGSPGRRRARSRGCLPPPVRFNRRIHHLAVSFSALSLNGPDVPLLNPTRHQVVSGPLVPNTRERRQMLRSACKDHAIQRAPQRIPACRKTPLAATKDTAFPCGSPMSICKPSPPVIPARAPAIAAVRVEVAEPLQHNLLGAMPMSICLPTAGRAREDIEIQRAVSEIIGKCTQSKDRAIQPAAPTALPLPRLTQPASPDAGSFSPISWASISPSPPKVTVQVPSPRPPPVQGGLRVAPKSPPHSPPGSFLEELRDMGEYDGPSVLERLAQDMQMTADEVMDW